MRVAFLGTGTMGDGELPPACPLALAAKDMAATIHAGRPD